MKHILRAQQFDKSTLIDLFTKTDQLTELYQRPNGLSEIRSYAVDKMAFLVFYEPSTRTRFSFGVAARNLGMDIIQTENARDFSSAVKGETLEDTIRVLCEYDPNIIILRHNETGGADRAAAVVDKFNYPVSIVNAGDGKGQHPTQALLDLYTIYSKYKRISDLTVTIGGDLLNGRTVRSLVYLLTKFKNVKMVFVSPHNLKMGSDIIAHLREHGVSFEETEDMESALSVADVVYWTRIQTERGSTNDLDLTIGPKLLSVMKKDSIILHPLPRVDEIAKVVDSDPRAGYFKQARNGMFIRMALLRDLGV